MEVLIPKLKAASEKFDMVPQPHHPACEIQPWNGKTDAALPDRLGPYFLKDGSGPKYLVGGALVRPLATIRQSAGRFAIASIEGSSLHENKVLRSSFVFENFHHAFFVSEGMMTFEIDDNSAAMNKLSSMTIGTGETVYVPKGFRFSFSFASKFTKAYIFTNGAGIIEPLCQSGTKYDVAVIPEKEKTVDQSRLATLLQEFSGRLS
jgi:mannose-6-phosphate isomerase-like protein (cupin superfamily)